MRQLAQQIRSARCATASPNLFRSGISTQLIPGCMTYCDVGQPGTPGWRVTPQRTLDTRDWIRGWILNQLSTRAAVTCEESPLGVKGGGWWADAFRGAVLFRSGSKLWTLQWQKSITETLMTAQRYVNESLSYLVDWGIADSVTADVAYVNKNVLTLTVTVKGPNLDLTVPLTGQQMPNFEWLWQDVSTSRSAA